MGRSSSFGQGLRRDQSTGLHVVPSLLLLGILFMFFALGYALGYKTGLDRAEAQLQHRSISRIGLQVAPDSGTGSHQRVPLSAEHAPNSPDPAKFAKVRPAGDPPRQMSQQPALPWSLQVGAFRKLARAETLMRKLEARGYPVTSARSPDGWYRVLVGPYDNKSLQQQRRQLNAEGFSTILRGS